MYRLRSNHSHPAHPTAPGAIAAAALTASLALLASACGGSSSAETADDPPVFNVQDEQTVDLESTTTTTAPADDASAGAGEGSGETPGSDPTFDESSDTIPTNDEEDADGEFFDAVGDFMACLTTEGYGFLGIPSEDLDETAPVNDPGYIDALRGCAASTQILDKMEAAEDTSSMSAADIEEANRQFAAFVDCLKGRGWTIPAPTPDENGVLQPSYIELSQTWIPPDGTSLLSDGSFNTDDFGECGFSADALN